jgi:hypothetical protein
MIDACVLDIKPHPEQATNNPGCWAVRLSVSYDGTTRTFWRWYNVRDLKTWDAERRQWVLSTDGTGVYIGPSDRTPTNEELIKDFWDDTFGNLHGFNFEAL